jgi:glycosyltransferase involved in cell wall biosynthesis
VVSVRIAVVVPAHDEAAGIGATLDALAAQTDRDFDLWVVDNASSDGTAAVVRAACAARGLAVTVVDEPEKGTGSASDTGIRHAIAAGATHVLRTDADTLPDPGWVAAGRRAFATGADLVTGPMRARTDEVPLKRWERAALPGIVGFCQLFGRFRPSNRGRDFRGPYLMSPGCNLGVSAAAYVRAGGFPRTAIEDVHEDRELVNRVRRVSRRVEFVPQLVVHASIRRLRAYGLGNTLRWYLDHGYRPSVVDVRRIA